VALALTNEQLDQLAADFGKPRTPETLETIERQIEAAADEATRGNLNAIDLLPSPIARGLARARFEEKGPAAGVTVRSGAGS
jgi:hypothetical protein